MALLIPDNSPRHISLMKENQKALSFGFSNDIYRNFYMGFILLEPNEKVINVFQILTIVTAPKIIRTHSEICPAVEFCRVESSRALSTPD